MTTFLMFLLLAEYFSAPSRRRRMLESGTENARTCSNCAEQKCANSGPIVDSEGLCQT